MNRLHATKDFWLAALRADGPALRDAVAEAGPDAAVPSCGQWTTADLVGYRWLWGRPLLQDLFEVAQVPGDGAAYGQAEQWGRQGVKAGGVALDPHRDFGGAVPDVTVSVGHPHREGSAPTAWPAGRRSAR